MDTKKWLFPDYQVSTKDKVVIKMTEDVIKFMEDGNVIPHDRGTLYFMPFVFARVEDSDIFVVHDMKDFPPEDYGLIGFKKMTDQEYEEWKMSFVAKKPEVAKVHIK